MFTKSESEINLNDDTLKLLPKWWLKAGSGRREEWLYRMQAVARRDWYDENQPHSNVDAEMCESPGEFFGNLRFWFIITGDDFMSRIGTAGKRYE